MTQENREAAAAAIVEGQRAVSNLAELHSRLEPCFGRVEPFRQARKYITALMSDLPRGIRDLEGEEDPGMVGRVRARGGGRKKAEVADPDLTAALDALIEPETRGDPESPLRWTTKSTRNIAGELTASGHPVSHTVVAFLLRYAGYS